MSMQTTAYLHIQQTKRNIPDGNIVPDILVWPAYCVKGWHFFTVCSHLLDLSHNMARCQPRSNQINQKLSRLWPDPAHQNRMNCGPVSCLLLHYAIQLLANVVSLMSVAVQLSLVVASYSLWVTSTFTYGHLTGLLIKLTDASSFD